MKLKNKITSSQKKYRTIRNPFSFEGIGVHSGKKTRITVIPSGGNIEFMKKGIEDSRIEACIDNVTDTTHGTTLGNGLFRFRTVEHILATFFALRVRGLTVVLEDGEEIPILDGSAKPIVEKLKKELMVEKLTKNGSDSLQIKSPITYKKGNCFISVFPSLSLKISYLINYDNYPELTQMKTLNVTDESFVNEIAPARTFAFLEWVKPLRKRGLISGGSFENALVYSKAGLLNKTELRFDDEFVRHKILDFLGDLSLLCRRLKGHFVIMRGGHTTHVEFLRKLARQTSKT